MDALWKKAYRRWQLKSGNKPIVGTRGNWSVGSCCEQHKATCQPGHRYWGRPSPPQSWSRALLTLSQQLLQEPFCQWPTGEAFRPGAAKGSKLHFTPTPLLTRSFGRGQGLTWPITRGQLAMKCKPQLGPYLSATCGEDPCSYLSPTYKVGVGRFRHVLEMSAPQVAKSQW